jgi:hypothetical protein
MSFLRNLIREVLINGKLLLGYVMLNIPELNLYPMLKGALEEFISHPTTLNGIRLLVQIFLAGGAGHRLLKIFRSAMEE